MKYGIELIRLIAVILITFTHTRNEFQGGSAYFFFEELPRIGTVLLSVISGYLYWEISRNRTSLIRNKVKTLLVPFLIANGIVLFLSAIAYFAFGYDVLNRLAFDHSLITEGLLALHSPPVNPPTYFIRDIFIVFAIIELFRNRNFYMLILLIPLAVFGQLILRYDIPVLFMVGVLISNYAHYIMLYKKQIVVFLALLSLALILFTPVDCYKYAVALLVFLLIIDRSIAFYNVGAFTYLLHLYHAPIIVVTAPFIQKVIVDPVLGNLLQVAAAVFGVLLLYATTRKFRFLRVLCGGK